MSFSPRALLAFVRDQLPADASDSLCIAFSGGLDSTVLLHALAQAVREDPVYRLRAVHIDHQLQAGSVDWEKHCAATAGALGVDYQSLRVNVPVRSDEGPESAARTCRYQALQSVLRPGETLLTAHHADDQLETVLLALVRGAGLRGLAAMPAIQRLGSGWHLRPLLAWSRIELESWARGESLAWIEDPSNASPDFTRNFLRQQITPRLRGRFAGVEANVARSAAHLAEGAALLDELARIDLADAALGSCLKVDVLAALPSARRRNLLRYWTRIQGARAPSTRKLSALEHDMLAAQEDRVPVVDWDGFEVRRHRGLLYASTVTPPAALAGDWDWHLPLELSGGLGRLRTETVQGRGLARRGLPPRLIVDFRHGGEALRPAGRDHHHKLKKLLQDADILPWWRNRVPLIWSGDALAAVGDLWIAEEFAAGPDEEGVAIVWESRPHIEAIQQ